MSLDLNAQKELFSIAYLHAVAARAGFMTAERQLDRDSVDWNISSADERRLPRRPQLELQLKSSADDTLTGSEIRFPLPVNNYDDLRIEDLVVPRILVVVRVPPNVDDWMGQSEDELVMRHCGYWASLRGLAAVPNTTTITVPIPRAQQFTPAHLDAMMERIDAGGNP